MTRQESLVMKGVTILMMLWLHLFMYTPAIDYTIFVDGEPLAKILCRACNPVAFFLILGGYGMYKVYQKGDNNKWQRIFKMYSNYWIVLSIALMIAVFIQGRLWYISSAKLLMYNFTGYWTTFNAEMWFLLPYVLLSLLSPYIFRRLAKVKGFAIIGYSLIIHLGTSYLISRYGAELLFNNMWIYNPLLVLHFLFDFLMGAVFARESLFEKIKCIGAQNLWIRHLGGVVMVVFIAIECYFKYNFFYALGLIICWQLIYIPKIIEKVLITLGKHSMNMWMIHTWICYYLFPDFITSFKNPMLMFTVLTILSLVAAVMVSLVLNTINRSKLLRPRLAKSLQ